MLPLRYTIFKNFLVVITLFKKNRLGLYFNVLAEGFMCWLIPVNNCNSLQKLMFKSNIVDTLKNNVIFFIQLNNYLLFSLLSHLFLLILYNPKYEFFLKSGFHLKKMGDKTAQK